MKGSYTMANPEFVFNNFFGDAGDAITNTVYAGYGFSGAARVTKNYFPAIGY
jgi:hypothetical protein